MVAMRARNVIKRCVPLIVGVFFLAAQWRSKLGGLSRRTHSLLALDTKDLMDFHECIEKLSECDASNLPLGHETLCTLLPSFKRSSETNDTAAIPRIIHQSWKDNVTLPLDFREWAQSWREKNPGFHYAFWTDKDNRLLVEQHYPWLLASYDALPAPIMRADIARYVYMLHHGGTYVDLDTWCTKPLDSLFHNFARTLQVPIALMAKISENDAFEHNIPVGASLISQCPCTV